MTVLLDTGWTYLANATPSVRDVQRNSTATWTPVTLPHTWNVWDSVDPVPGYRRDAGWYRRTLARPARTDGRRTILAFEAANTVADVYVNGTRAGGHVGGYIGFRVDVTPFLHAGANDVLVRVDNADRADLIPSDKSDFIIYGGLTRDVWLERVPPVSIGYVAVRTPAVSRDSASTAVDVELRAPAFRGAAIGTRGTAVLVELRAPNGSVAATATKAVPAVADSIERLTVTLPTIQHPALWSPAAPTLYHVTVSLRRADSVVDRSATALGYRWVRWAPHGAFYLNGERLLLRGTHRHEEAAGYGGALPNAVERADMAAIKAMGANFVRLAHYPQDPEVYRAADSLGLLLWDELPWCRGGVGDAQWKANTERLLREQIRQNISHPSIILWSLGNEIHDVVDSGPAADVGAIRAYLAHLDTVAHALDPSRFTALRKFDAGATLVDVYSPSIWAGWDRGDYHDYAKALRAVRRKWPRVIHMEYGADALTGRHSESPPGATTSDSGYTELVGHPVQSVARTGDWSESYQTDLLDWYLMVSEQEPELTGTAQWAFRDFATPLRPENPIPYVNEKGLVDRSGARKDAYYVFRSYWTTTPRFVYLVSHTWTERQGAADATHEVRAYSNCAAVSLEANGAALGIRRRNLKDFPAQGLRWPVHFRAGQNQLVARCVDDALAGDSTRDALIVHYSTRVAGASDHIALATAPLANGDLLVEATVVDATGARVLSDRSRMYFSYNGSGRLHESYGTPTGSAIIETANGRAAIELTPPAAGQRGEITVRTQDINGARLALRGPARVH